MGALSKLSKVPNKAVTFCLRGEVTKNCLKSTVVLFILVPCASKTSAKVRSRAHLIADNLQPNGKQPTISVGRRNRMWLESVGQQPKTKKKKKQDRSCQIAAAKVQGGLEAP